jgi:hypothetical protein
VIAEVAERRGVAVAPAEEMLIDAEDLRTLPSSPFSRQLSQPGAEPALHGRAGDPFAFCQAAAADAIEVLLTNRTPERFTGTHARQNPGKTLPETAPAAQATPFSGFQFDHTMPHTPALVARPPYPQILHPKICASTMRTANLPR